MKNEIELFFTAIMFFTRIPVPEFVFTPEKLNSSSRYFSAVGLLVGTLTSILFMIFINIFSISITVLFTMIFSILLTGAFHEDGFADFCDGFGGGYTKEKILEIMVDSRIGVYGAIGIFLMLFLKFLILVEMKIILLPLILISGHTLSRFVSISILYSLNYVKTEGKSKPIATKMNLTQLLIGFIFVLIPLFFFKSYLIFLIFIPQIFIRYLFQNYIYKKIGGYTGDCLGAMQQISEIIFYISIYGLLKWKFI